MHAEIFNLLNFKSSTKLSDADETIRSALENNSIDQKYHKVSNNIVAQFGRLKKK